MLSNPTSKHRVCLYCGKSFIARSPSRPNLYCKPASRSALSTSCKALDRKRASREARRSSREPRFWAKVDKTSSPHGCWLWTGSTSLRGYGRFRGVQAHRFSWELANGPIPPGLLVCHNCPGGDNPSCVNPAHLWLGTDADNAQDAVKKGQMPTGDRNGSRLHPETRPRGERHPRAKLTAAQVREIRSRTSASESALAAEFKVAPSQIWSVRKRRTWKHV